MTSPGITFKAGNKTYGTAEEAFRGITRPLRSLQKQIGDLTKPFDQIAGVMVADVKHRFNTGELGYPPYRPAGNKRSRFTRNVRKAKGQDPDGETLKASGDMRDAVQRMPSPTKSKEGGQREVYRLVLGVNGSKAPYYRKQLLGGIWEVPVRIGPRGGMHFDPDRIPGSSMTSSRYWGPNQWKHYEKLPEGFAEVEVPPTNIFHMSTVDDNEIRNILLDWLYRAGIKA